MPKILENMRQQLLAEARRQIIERGYGKTTIRSVAAGCSVAVGTVYNYFPSKDMLIASFVAEDWKRCLDAISAYATTDAEAYLMYICDTLRGFADLHSMLFTDADAAKVFSAVSSQRHSQLRSQLAERIEPILCEGVDREFLAQFIAEALLTWTMAKTPFDRLYAVIRKLINH